MQTKSHPEEEKMFVGKIYNVLKPTSVFKCSCEPRNWHTTMYSSLSRNISLFHHLLYKLSNYMLYIACFSFLVHITQSFRNALGEWYKPPIIASLFDVGRFFVQCYMFRYLFKIQFQHRICIRVAMAVLISNFAEFFWHEMCNCSQRTLSIKKNWSFLQRFRVLTFSRFAEF